MSQKLQATDDNILLEGKAAKFSNLSPSLSGIGDDALSLLLLFLDLRSLCRCEQVAKILRKGVNKRWPFVLAQQKKDGTNIDWTKIDSGPLSDKQKAVRHYRLITVLKDTSSSMIHHFGEPGALWSQQRDCLDEGTCSFPKQLHTGWTRNPDHYNYFVSITATKADLSPPVNIRGVFTHLPASILSEKRYYRDIEDEASAVLAVNLPIPMSDVLRETATIQEMIIIASHKASCAAGLMYASNRQISRERREIEMQDMTVSTHISRSDRYGDSDDESHESLHDTNENKPEIKTESNPGPPWVKADLKYEPEEESDPFQVVVQYTDPAVDGIIDVARFIKNDQEATELWASQSRPNTDYFATT